MPRGKLLKPRSSWEGRRLVGAVDSAPAFPGPAIRHVEEVDSVGAGRNDDWFAPFDGKPVEAVPAYAIDCLLRPKSFFDIFPWPYDIPQMKIIVSLVNPSSLSVVASDIVYRTRLFIFAQRARANLPKKAAPQDEIEQLREAARRLNTAISGLSLKARQYLRERCGPAGSDVDDLGTALHRFQIDNRIALESPPEPKDMRGRPESSAANVRSYFAGIFVAAHSGLKPARGQPKFVELCCAPLGLIVLTPEGIEKSTSRNARRKGT